MTVHSRVSGSIYFLGRYRPCHFEAESVSTVANQMFAATDHVADLELRLWLIERIVEVRDSLNGSESYSSTAVDHCDRGVSFALRPHDPWLDATTDSMPPCPGLDYSRGMS